jgi:hypothetical protein
LTAMRGSFIVNMSLLKQRGNAVKSPRSLQPSLVQFDVGEFLNGLGLTPKSAKELHGWAFPTGRRTPETVRAACILHRGAVAAGFTNLPDQMLTQSKDSVPKLGD